MISEMIIARNGSEKEQLIAVCTATKILHPRTATSFANISLLSRSLSHAPHRCGMLLQTLQLCVLWSVLGILVSPAKTDEQIKMPLLQNHVGPTNHVLDLGAHWRHLLNTIERSVRSGDGALGQTTLTTCYMFVMALRKAYWKLHLYPHSAFLTWLKPN